MAKKFVVAGILIILVLGCSKDSRDQNARAMGGAYAALLTKYQKLMESAESDSAYRSLRENRQADLKKLLEQYREKPSSNSLELIRSEVLIDLKSYDSALVKLNKIIDNQSSWADFARFQKVRVLQENGKIEEAFSLFKKVEDKVDVNNQYIDVLTTFAYEAPQLADQEKYSRKLLAMNQWPDNDLSYRSYMYENLALIEKQKGNLDSAVATLRKAVAELKDTVDVRALESTLKLIDLIGQPAPALFAETWLNSRPLKLNDLKGKVVLVDFWAPWCAPCRAVIPTLVDEYRNKKDKGLVILGYTRLYGHYRDDLLQLGKVEPKDEIRLTGNFLKRYKMEYPVAIAQDKTGFNAYFITGIPTLIFIDKNGNVADFKIGSGNEQYLRDRINQLLYVQKAG
jgi:thiol-disulfide isomerase/thioredoxin